MTLIINLQSLSLGQTLSKVVGGALRLFYKNVYMHSCKIILATEHACMCIYRIYTCMHAQLLNHVLHSVIPWTVACQAPLSTGFPRQEYRSRLPFLLQGSS